MEKNNKISELEQRISDLESKPYRCEVCGKPTDGWTKTLFGRHHFYCRKHYPVGFTGAVMLDEYNTNSFHT